MNQPAPTYYERPPLQHAPLLRPGFTSPIHAGSRSSLKYGPYPFDRATFDVCHDHDTCCMTLESTWSQMALYYSRRIQSQLSFCLFFLFFFFGWNCLFFNCCQIFNQLTQIPVLLLFHFLLFSSLLSYFEFPHKPLLLFLSVSFFASTMYLIQTPVLSFQHQPARWSRLHSCPSPSLSLFIGCFWFLCQFRTLGFQH